MTKQLPILQQQEILGKQLTLYGNFENPLFLAKEVADWIEHSNVSVMLQSIDDDEKELHQIGTLNNAYSAWFLTEYGVYEVLMQSRKPIAKQFKKEVKAILKEIRMKGAYLHPGQLEEILYNPDLIINLCKQMKQQQQNIHRLETEITTKNHIIGNLECVPKTKYYDVIQQTKDPVAISRIARDYDMPKDKLNRFLQARGIQFQKGNRWFLYKSYAGQGYARFKTNYSTTKNNEIHAHTYILWTQKGRLFIYNLLKGEGILPLIERWHLE